MITIKLIPYAMTWGIRHRVMWPTKSMDYVKLPNDKDGLHYGLFVADQLVSIISVFISEEEAQFRKFATLQEVQGKGYGSQLLTYVLKELAKKQVKRVWCNARTDKTGFYERFGLVKTDQQFSRGTIHYIIMEKRFQ